MSSQLIDGVVIPYPDGRKEHNTRFWRDATDLELEQAARIEELEKREWVDLTKEEVDSWELPDSPTTVFEFVQFIEAKIKDKNI